MQRMEVNFDDLMEILDEVFDKYEAKQKEKEKAKADLFEKIKVGDGLRDKLTGRIYAVISKDKTDNATTIIISDFYATKAITNNTINDKYELVDLGLAKEVNTILSVIDFAEKRLEKHNG